MSNKKYSQFDVIAISRGKAISHLGEERIEFDAADHVSNRKFYASLASEFDPIWAVVDATGFSRSGKFLNQNWESAQEHIDVNLLNPMNIISIFGKRMEKSGGRLIFFSSILVQKEVFGTVSYSVSKVGLEQLIFATSLECKNENFKILGIRLGYFDFGMIRQLSNQQIQGIKKINVFESIIEILDSMLCETNDLKSGTILEIS
jgi:NAD(P)-dependent dehydrogenase (short-subunit alcohol dehydrogenase family)